MTDSLSLVERRIGVNGKDPNKAIGLSYADGALSHNPMTQEVFDGFK